MEKTLSLVTKYIDQTLQLSFDKEGKFLKNKVFNEILNYTVYESSTYMNVHSDLPTAIMNAVYLLKSGKEMNVNLYIKVLMNNEEIYLHLLKISVDLRLEYIYFENHNLYSKFNYLGKVLEINNEEQNTELISECIKAMRNSSSIEKDLKVKYYEDINEYNINNITFYAYIQKKDRTPLFNEAIRCIYNLNKVIDTKNFYPITVCYKKIRGEDIAGYWWYAYKIIELDPRFDRDTVRSVFYHEYGHLIFDYIVIDNKLPEAVQRQAKQMLHCILTILNCEDTINDIEECEVGKFKKYLLTPTEIFARLFASYMIYEQDVKAQFEINNFNIREVDTVKPLLEALLELIQCSVHGKEYKCKCAACGKKEDIQFFAVIPHSEEFVNYNWYCAKCLENSKKNIKELYKIELDKITDDKLEYLKNRD